MLTIESAKTATQNEYCFGNNYPHGLHCEFLEFDEIPGWGAKVYYSKKKRNENFKNHTKAAKVELAPKIGPRYSIKVKDEICYCYATQVAETLIDSRDSQDWDSEEDCRLNRKWDKEIYELTDKLREEIEFEFEDSHLGNVGLVNGRLVCLDFGVMD